MIPKSTVVPHGTSPYILLTIWYSHCDIWLWAKVLGTWTEVLVIVRWQSDVCDKCSECRLVPVIAWTLGVHWMIMKVVCGLNATADDINQPNFSLADYSAGNS